MSDAATSPDPLSTSKGVIGDSWRLLFRNYWQFAILGVVYVVVGIVISLLNLIPLLGQLLGVFLSSLVFGLAMLIALAIARREDNAFGRVATSLAPQRLLELAIAMVPIGLLGVLEYIAEWWALVIGLGGFAYFEAGALFGLPGLIVALLFVVVFAYVTVKLAFTAYFIAAVPAEAAMAPLARMRQSASLTKGRTSGFVIAYLLVKIVGGLFSLIPLLGPIVIGAAFTIPFEFAALVVIYHRLTARALPGLTKRQVTAADKSAETVKPI